MTEKSAVKIDQINTLLSAAVFTKQYITRIEVRMNHAGVVEAADATAGEKPDG